jgi:hypothetical protein
MGKDRMKKPIIIFNLLLLALLVVACQAPQAMLDPTPIGVSTPTWPPTPIPTLTPTPLPGTPIPFQTLTIVGDGVGLGSYYHTRQRMFVIATQEDFHHLKWIPYQEWFEPLQSIDYSTHLAIVVFQSVQPSTGYSTEVMHISRKDDVIFVDTEMRDPSYFTKDGVPIITSDVERLPYHIVAMEKEGLYDKMTFILVANTEFLEELEVEIDQN